MGLCYKDYIRRFDRANVLVEFPGRHKRDDKFPLRDAKLAARSMKQLLKGRHVILVGRNVAAVFNVLDLPFHHASEYHDWCKTLAVVPHTSGRNHWYNSAANREEARRFWLQHIPAILDTKLLLSAVSRGTYMQHPVLGETGASYDDSHVSGHPVH
jgi:hypothetical protein